MNRTLSIPEWHRLSSEGKAPPVKITLNGCSMHPLIRKNKDHVTIVSHEGNLMIGDIVLFCEPETGRYVVHRLWDRKNEKALTWGDYCPGPDRWIPYDAIWGKVILIERGQKKIVPNPAKGILWAKIWHREVKIQRLYERYKNGIIRRADKLKRFVMRGNT